MEIIVGTVILNEDKILMVREAKKQCYNKWAFPAGHLEKNETIFEGAKRETLEETGCRVELKKAFPIYVHNAEDKAVIMMHFLANIIEDNLEYNTDEILETRWISINELKNMNKEEFRSYPVVKNILKSLETQELYELDLYKDLQNI